MMKTKNTRHSHVSGLLSLRHSHASGKPSKRGAKVKGGPAFAGMTLLLVILYSATAFAQNITKAEYFFDDDPGVGSGIDIPITPAANFDINIVLPQSLSAGTHTLSVRTQDENGVWGFTERRQFYIPAATTTDPPIADVTAMEYFIDNDPGFGAGTTISISTNSIIDLPLEMIDANTLPAGFHLLGVRTQNTDGVWGFTERRQFYIVPGTTTDPPVVNMVALEYFFDTDPGMGNATSISISTGMSIDINELIPESLTSGYHSIYIRAKNANDVWGFSESRPVYIKPTVVTESISDIAEIEYYFDGEDPGVGNATTLPITPGPLVDLNTVDVATSLALIDGEHEITFRAKNADGVWGMAETSTFDVLDDCTQPVAGFTPQLACAGQLATFTDTSTDIQGDATYRWYLNGDATIDDTTVGDATFTYNVPGVYVVALAIRQGTICLDSIATTITIQPEPVAVFSAVGTAVNLPTNFTASTNNMPDGAMWEWDFEGDFVVDDNTVGATSFTYTTENTFNPILTITDGLGCIISVTNPITITASGGGGSPPPSAAFLPENGCVGNNISFVDLSQNIPEEATYSWDFDGDGLEDDNTTGTGTFLFSSSGFYDVKLSINTGSTTVETTETIEIVAVPIPNFSTVEVCEGAVVNFTDLSTNASPTAVYMWDFDNDGVVDSNAKTGINHTYNSQGFHIVSLTISNGFGCTQEIVKQVSVVGLPTPDFAWDIICTNENISFNNLSTNVASGATYSWDLDGDGNEDFNTNGDVDFSYPNNGIYNASLTIANAVGCETTTIKPIEIVDRPITALAINAQCYGQPSQMVDMSQDISPTATYIWDFDNDGSTDSNTVGSTEFTYSSYDTYVVNLTISNGGGCSSSVEELVVFSDAATPDFTVNKTCQGEEVVFTDISSNLEMGAIYSWDFDGDGNEDTATPSSTVNTFSSAGTYNATLTIDNGGHCLAHKTIALEVTPPPAVDLGANLNLCTEGEVTFDAGVGYTSYLWPDGSTNQTYTVDKVGEYIVKVQDAKSCFNTDTVSVSLLGPPVPTFDHLIELSLEGIKIHFTNTTTNGDSYTWAFGDGASSDENEPTHIYSDFSFYETSVYEVCVTATNACEEATFCESIFVSPTEFIIEAGNEINVYPNPAYKVVNIEINKSKFETKQVGLINMQGKLMWSTNMQEANYEINMSQFTPGVYFVMLKQKDKFFFKRIIKQ